MEDLIQLKIAGVPCVARRYVGIGSLNVSTPKGEVKASYGDFILEFETLDTVVVGSALMERFVEAEVGDPEEIAATLPLEMLQSVLPPTTSVPPSLDVLRFRKARGEKLTDMEEARLADGK